MTGPITRKIELARQIEEARRLVAEASTAKAGKYGRLASEAEERLSRREAILRTLEWNQEHEHEIRAWLEEKRRVVA